MCFGSVKFKVIIITILCLSVGSTVIGHLLGVSHNENLKLVSEEAIRISREIFYNIEMNNTRTLSAMVQFLSENDSFKKPFIKNDREALYETTLPLFNKFKDRYGITHWSFIKPRQGECFLRVHEPKKFGDVFNRATYDKSVQINELSYGKELGETTFALWVVYPYYHKEKLIGHMELGEDIGYFLELMKKQTGNEYGLLIDKDYMNEKEWTSMKASGGLANNWNDLRDVVLVSKTTDSARMIQFDGTISDIPDKGIVFDNLRKDGKTFVRGAFPVYDVKNRKIGAVYVLHEVTKIFDELKSLQSKVVIYMTVLAVILAALITIVFNNGNKTDD